jgi:hypothetical protein
VPVPFRAQGGHAIGPLGTPSFVWLSSSGWPAFSSPAHAARAVLSAMTPTFRLNEAAIASLDALAVHESVRGPFVARFLQRVSGIDVFRSGLNVAMSRTFEPVAVTGLVASNVSLRASAFERDEATALAMAHQRLTGEKTSFRWVDEQGPYRRFASASQAHRLAQLARAKKVYFPTKDGLEPAFYVELLLVSGAAHAYVVSAQTGEILFSNDLVRHDAYAYRVWANANTLVPNDGPQGNDTIPLQVPARTAQRTPATAQTLVSLSNVPFSKNDPWLLPGASTTDGNNVRAYSDVASEDGFTPNSADTFASVTSASTFDTPFDSSVSAGTTPDAVKTAITQMFYTTNFLHDWYYDSGFDEKSGNHQVRNFGRGGVEGDPLLAETQDFSGRNNANAATPADGASPRIQMFLFGGPSNAGLTVLPPATIAGKKNVGTAGQFGKDSFETTAEVVLVTDGGGADTHDGCEPVRESLTGKIALVHRGQCAFVQKAKSAQSAGAVGVLIANVGTSVSPAAPPFMGGTAADVVIPALSLSLVDGQALEATAGAIVTMKRDPSKNIDGALDNQIVSHEWGHVMSNRLIADGSGLDTEMAVGLGEGWADFSAQLLAVRSDDALVRSNAHWNGVYPSATFATGGMAELYFGIRRVPYSTDMTKNPLTFKHIQDGVPLPTTAPIAFGEDGSANSEVHNTGEVWATMLWECYAALLNDSRMTFDEAQRRMKAYFVASLKLTPPSPTLLEARDALLAVAYAADLKDFDLFWHAFAKRGAGVGAVAPPRDSAGNRGVVESFDVGSAVAIESLSLKDDVLSCDHDGIVDEGETGTLDVTVRNSGATVLEKTTAKVTSKSSLVSFADDGIVSFGSFRPFETKKATIKLAISGAADVEPVVIDVAVSDPSLVRGQPVHVALPVRHASDEVPGSSATDAVETDGTAWTASGTGGAKWNRIHANGNGSWFIPNAGEPADQRLTSPPFEVKKGEFTLSWKHRWSFEFSEAEKKDFDGGVVELSVDGGKTWDDISVYGTVDYNVTLDDDPKTKMVLKGRKAYGRTSPGYPENWVVSKIHVTLKSLEAVANVRFRHGADDNTGAVGWEIDDISLSDIANTPFGSFVPQRDVCDVHAPTAIAPPGQTVLPKTIVRLEGKASVAAPSSSSSSSKLGFSWHQVAGPSVYLSGRDTSTLAIETPEVQKPVTLTFALRANDGALVSSPSLVDVVVAPRVPELEQGCSCQVLSRSRLSSQGFTLALGFVALVVRRRRRLHTPRA